MHGVRSCTFEFVAPQVLWANAAAGRHFAGTQLFAKFSDAYDGMEPGVRSPGRIETPTGFEDVAWGGGSIYIEKID